MCGGPTGSYPSRCSMPYICPAAGAAPLAIASQHARQPQQITAGASSQQQAAHSVIAWTTAAHSCSCGLWQNIAAATALGSLSRPGSWRKITGLQSSPANNKSHSMRATPQGCCQSTWQPSALTSRPQSTSTDMLRACSGSMDSLPFTCMHSLSE